MVDYLSDIAGHPKVHGIRPHSLKVTTIATLMEEITGRSNFPQLATRGNYRAVAPHDMGKTYYRNVARQQLIVSNFAQSAFCANTKPESIKIGPPAFSANTCPDDIDVSESKPNGHTAYDWAIKLLGGGECVCLWQRKLSAGNL